MNTINPREDMFADFFQVGGYSNLAGQLFGGNPTADTLFSLRMPFSTLANKGKSVPSYKNHKEIYDRLKREVGYTDSELNAFFDEFKRQKGDFMNAMDFYEFVNQSMSTQTTKTQFIEPPKVEPDVVDVSDIDFSEPPKKELSFLTIGLGVVVLVGITILLVRKK